eukprot:GHVP01029201.1.p2 GENE.GHVP01029201.1~~GHVP01029201.1.p2  ORF type:complete len:124 (+),score=2.93 GHVP01029201.1:48-419(+)
MFENSCTLFISAGTSSNHPSPFCILPTPTTFTTATPPTLLPYRNFEFLPKKFSGEVLFATFKDARVVPATLLPYRNVKLSYKYLYVHMNRIHLGSNFPSVSFATFKNARVVPGSPIFMGRILT